MEFNVKYELITLCLKLDTECIYRTVHVAKV